MKKIFLFSFSILMGCSGYRFSRPQNPLSQYGIRSLSVPMFFNYSNISHAHVEFTREIYKMLTQFSGLQLKNGYDKKNDAVLFGVLRSPEKVVETIAPSNLRLAQSNAPQAIGNKRDVFYVPGSSDITLFLQIILIKKPTDVEIALMQSADLNQLMKNHSKVIFSETLTLRHQFTREIMDQAGKEVIATQNLGVRNKSLKTMAHNAATSIRDMIFYAF